MRFKDKVVLILGGNSGIGLASAKAFAAESGIVHITGRDQATIDAAVVEIDGARGYRADMADLAAMEEMISAIEAQDGRIDVLFVNAGVGGFAPIRELTPEDWDKVHDINLRGAVFAIQKALRLMGRGGAIVVTGSIGGHGVLPGNAAYGAAKAGLAMAVKIIAAELVGEGIRVNMVSPGPIETPLLHRNPGISGEAVAALREQMIAAVPMRRMGQAEEVARAVLFFASEDASFVTAANLFIDGGALELG
ncbi:dehydrogenase [Sphingobium jiangsuense]|uniref:NAD(P)-dependent dehydrogenase (Short-subunit alcohol dehydrogenase family) n=1 Tax=Sphingobium jiangsuense TaxID=870476 RepID=A0A7W6BK60_9SPHN|nr:SDR family oxidoreductase [Sphingobium jiangsuense]MBB3928546.1 NAD(P)-dependent dehydrogenase (short-subunit alcohol dehydrogenase family) [Sphingobium jiangsuense]GLT02159.1 dehydrogenase [Sphingobium jiangsuense]